MAERTPSLGVLGAMKRRAKAARQLLTTKREAQGKTAGERYGADGQARPQPRGSPFRHVSTGSIPSQRRKS